MIKNHVYHVEQTDLVLPCSKTYRLDEKFVDTAKNQPLKVRWCGPDQLDVARSGRARCGRGAEQPPASRRFSACSRRSLDELEVCVMFQQSKHLPFYFFGHMRVVQQ